MISIAFALPAATSEQLLALTARLATLGRVLTSAEFAERRPASTAQRERRAVEGFIAVFESPTEAVAATMLALREPGCCVGIGIDGIDAASLAKAPEGRVSGPGLQLARRSVSAAVAKGASRQVPVLVAGAVPSHYADAAQAVLHLVGRIVLERSAAQWRVLDQLVPGERGGQGLAAEVLGISSQAVSKAVSRSGWAEEWEGRSAAALLLAAAQQTITDWS